MVDFLFLPLKLLHINLIQKWNILNTLFDKRKTSKKY